MDLLILVPLFIIVFISTSKIERKLITLTKQNQKIIELLETVAERKQ